MAAADARYHASACMVSGMSGSLPCMELCCVIALLSSPHSLRLANSTMIAIKQLMQFALNVPPAC